MMGLDELCLISGIRPQPSVGLGTCFVGRHDMDRVVAEMVDESKVISKAVPSDLDSILRESLELAAYHDVNYYKEENHWKPPGLTQRLYFNKLGCCEELYQNDDGAYLAPGGRDVELRRAYTDQDSIWFDYVIPGDIGCEKKEQIRSHCTTDSGNLNFFVMLQIPRGLVGLG